MTNNSGAFLALLFIFFWTIPSVQLVGFGDIPGDYCKYRSPQCCTSRDDDCTAPILGNHLCYCDTFCGQHPGRDCCPDYAEVCEGGPSRQSHEDFGADCVDNAGVRHGRGQRYKYNCQACTCGSGCDATPCVINTDLLQKVNDGRYSWRGQNYSEFWGQSLDDGVKYRLGTLYPERSVQNMNEILLEERPVLPAHFDAREKWPSFIHPIRDQKNCGSSWAFSTTAVSADRLAIQSEGKSDSILSTQQLISCNQLKQRGCTGGYLDRAWWYIHKLGVVSESCYPYESGWTNQIGECKIPKDEYRTAENTSCPSGSRDSKIYKTTPTYRISSKEEDIQAEIITNGPVQATFLVHEDFYMYSGGVYQHLDLARDLAPGHRKSAYHSVRVIGWGVDTSTGRPIKYWLCDNSWGTEWGEDGFFRILRGENHCEIESFVLAAWGRGSKRRKAYLTKKVRKLFRF